MLRPVLVLLVATGVLGGCVWDGPPRDVRVVASAGRVTAEVDLVPPVAPAVERGDDGATDGDEPSSGSVEDRVGTFGMPQMPTTVAVVGDSLTVAATEEITTALSRVGVRAVVVDGRVGRRMASSARDLPSGVAVIEGLLAEQRPDLWVVALGTNDVGAGAGAERFVGDLRETVAVLPSDAPVVWVDVWIRDRFEDVVEANTLLRAELGRRPAPTLVVDWFSSAIADGVITGDGVHLTDVGQARFASAIADGVVALASSTG